jgi:hypothetical protein
MPSYIGLSDAQISALTALLALVSGLGMIGLGWLLARCAGEMGKPFAFVMVCPMLVEGVAHFFSLSRSNAASSVTFLSPA